jgi:hypothetical protein
LELGKSEGRGETCEGLQTAEGGTHPASWQHLGRGISRPSPNPTQLAWALTQGQGLRCRGAFEAGVGARQDSTAGSLAWRPGAHSHACGAIVPASPAHAAQAIREGQSISFAQSAERCGPRNRGRELEWGGWANHFVSKITASIRADMVGLAVFRSPRIGPDAGTTRCPSLPAVRGY